jgi:DoxX-like family
MRELLEFPMVTAYLVVTLLAIAANAFSGVAALAHFQPIIPGMVKAGVPESWLTFPIGTLKAAGAVGLLLGPVGVPLVGTAAAIGLVLFFVCAIYTHVRARLLAAVRLGGRVPLAGRGRADIGNGLALSGSSIPALVPSSVMSLSTEQVDSRLP